MSEKIKVYNKMKFNIGIKTPENQNGINIRPGSFTVLDENDIEYLMSTCTLLQLGWLQVEEKHEPEVLEKLGIEKAESAAFMTDEEIQKKLGGNIKAMEKWLNGINDPVELNRIADIAVEQNLSLGKIKLIQAKVPNRDLSDE